MPDTYPFMMKDTHFYAMSATALVGLAVTAGAALNLVGMKQDQVATIVVTIMGFAALIMSQFRTALQVDRKTEEVRVALENATAEASLKAEEVKRVLVLNNEENAKRTGQVAENLAEAHRAWDEQLTEIQTVGEVVHNLVDSQHGIVLNHLAVALRTLANITKSAKDSAVADEAEKASQAHDAVSDVVKKAVSAAEHILADKAISRKSAQAGRKKAQNVSE